jgi:DNA relaxase NicK
MSQNTVHKTTIDWFRLRTRSNSEEVLEALKPLFGGLGTYLRVAPLERGIMGFKRADGIFLADMQVARFDYGGESQKGWGRLDMPGKPCVFVQDWDALDGLAALEDAEIRRLDIALTTSKGEVNHELVKDAHSRGRFITRGRPPELREISSTDAVAGRTCEIGTREKSDKFMRCYEKGWEMIKDFPHHMREGCTSINGVHPSLIYRSELELKAVNMTIHFETIYKRDQYFAGAYPFCSDILPGVECDILTRNPKLQSALDIEAALANCRNQFGNTLFTALTYFHGDVGEVWSKICGDKHSPHLVESGVLLHS